MKIHPVQKMPAIGGEHIGVDFRAFDGFVPEELAHDLQWPSV